MSKQNNLLKVRLVTMQVGQPVLVKQQNSERAGNWDQITADPASCPLHHTRPAQKKMPRSSTAIARG